MTEKVEIRGKPKPKTAYAFERIPFPGISAVASMVRVRPEQTPEEARKEAEIALKARVVLHQRVQ